MIIVVNGKNIEIAEKSLSIFLLIKCLQLPELGIAVAVETSVIPRSQWNDFFLEEGAKVTIISATQGG